MSNEPKWCKAIVTGERGWHTYACHAKAVTEAGFCRLHDPELKAARAAKRPPTKFEQWQKARRELDAFIDQLAPEIQEPLRKLREAEWRLR